ncbi:MAG: efflux RND transporter periplasmic adaptor subunit [Verrucomicrobia bacterium]|nr:efflux RND transporter periplasmic adaptor subunit [Verrucomicrobiota bacterium]
MNLLPNLKTYLLPAAASLIGLFAAWSIARTQPHHSLRDPLRPPASPTFEHTVAAVGLIEPSSESIAIGSPYSGIVTRVFVQSGQTVKAGEPLFQLDDRSLKASVAVQSSQRATAEARVKTATAQLEDLQDQLKRAERLRADTVVSEEEVTRREYQVRLATARLEEARADVLAATAAQHAAETELERSLVRAPLDATVLQVKIRNGEAIASGIAGQAPLVLGRLDPLHVRVDIDEHESWRVKSGARATGHLRGNSQLPLELVFVRFEPLVVPKRSLTGDPTERVDTRVLQAIYRIEPQPTGIFPGQQVDVFLEAAPLPTSLTQAKTRPASAP